MEKFEVGKQYFGNAVEYDPILIVKRTEKTVVVENSTNRWRMLIHHDGCGNEYLIDSSVPERWREAFYYSPYNEYSMVAERLGWRE